MRQASSATLITSRHTLLVPTALVALAVVLCPSIAEPRADRESAVKAALLVNLTKFIRWPTSDLQSDRLTLCVLGEDTLGEALDRFEGKKVRGRALHIVRLKQLDSRRCQVLFISPSEDGRMADVLRKLGRSATLTVGDTKRFARRGGVIAFRKEKQRITLVCNIKAAKRARLSLSSRLLKLMKLVRP